MVHVVGMLGCRPEDESEAGFSFGSPGKAAKSAAKACRRTEVILWLASVFRSETLISKRKQTKG